MRLCAQKIASNLGLPRPDFIEMKSGRGRPGFNARQTVHSPVFTSGVESHIHVLKAWVRDIVDRMSNVKCPLLVSPHLPIFVTVARCEGLRVHSKEPTL